MPITLTDQVSRVPDALASNIDNELMILNMETNNYVALDEIGRRIWEIIETPVTIRDLCAQLAREFRAQPGQIEADVLAFLNQMSAEKLVNVLPG